MKKELFFARFCGERFAACTEDGVLMDVGVESEADGELLGNIYKGKVANVLTGMQAAFVACGLEKNCYLPLGEGASCFSSYDGEGNITERELKEGDEILVQIVKLPRGGKGAKVTRALSFVGKNLIYLPETDFLGISRKITDEAVREELLKETDRLRKSGEGFIVRTSAEKAEKKQRKAEADYLKKLYATVMEKAKNAPVGAVVFRECSLPVQIMRDSWGDGLHKIYVDDKETYETVLSLARFRRDIGEKKIVLYGEARGMLSRYGILEQMYQLAETTIALKNGGNLVIDRTEAMTVIDVNTGKFTGETDLESTAYETNLCAAREIARLARVRNVGGLIAVDFVDMAEEAHREAVNEELAGALEADRTKCRVYPMNELCVTLFTRKRTKNDLLSFLLKPCPHCTRQGYVFSDLFMVMRIREQLLDLFADGYRSAIVELNRGLMEKILSERYLEEDVRGAFVGKRVYMIPHSAWHEEKFTARGDNSGVLSLPDKAQILY